jgi:hypothetical protein
MLWVAPMESHLAYFAFGFGALFCARLLRKVERETGAEARSGGIRLTTESRHVVSIEEFRLATVKRSRGGASLARRQISNVPGSDAGKLRLINQAVS